MAEKTAHSEDNSIGQVQVFPDQPIPRSDKPALTALAKNLGATDEAGQICFSLRFQLPNRSGDKIIDFSGTLSAPLPPEVNKMILCGIILGPPGDDKRPEYKVFPELTSHRPSGFTVECLLAYPRSVGYWVAERNEALSWDKKIASFTAVFTRSTQAPAAKL